MNLMRKLMGTGHNLTTSQSDPTLGIVHLKKMFEEFRTCSTSASQSAQEKKLYNMLPLFCRIFGETPTELMTKFADILQLSSHISRLMVLEIRRRASNQSTESASSSIVSFLEIGPLSDEQSDGWMLLTTINILSQAHPTLLDQMTAASLPSTLVKSLYLFFDLPPIPADRKCTAEGEEPVYNSQKRRDLLVKMFSQILTRLMTIVPAAEELATRDDLTLLFTATTNWCPAYNTAWRKLTGDILVTLSRHSLRSVKVVQYIHEKGCIALCVDNMKRGSIKSATHDDSDVLSFSEIVNIFVTVFYFLKDSSEITEILMDDFRHYKGYTFLYEFILSIDKDHGEEATLAGRNLLHLIGSLVNCGHIEIRPTAISGHLFSMKSFVVPQPQGRGTSVRNLDAFRVLQDVFIKASFDSICLTILEVINTIYHQDNANYFILESENTIPQISEYIHLKSLPIQKKFFEIVEFIVFELNYVPCKELISFCMMIKTNHCSGLTLKCVQCLQTILLKDEVFKDVFRSVGLFEVYVYCMIQYAALLRSEKTLTHEEQCIGQLCMRGLADLISNCSENAVVMKEQEGNKRALELVADLRTRQLALSICQQMALSQNGDDELSAILELLYKTSTINDVRLHIDILKSVISILRESHRVRTAFRRIRGFHSLMTVLISLEGCYSDKCRQKVSLEELNELIRTIFVTMNIAMKFEPANAKLFENEVRYLALTNSLKLLGCFGNNTVLRDSCRNTYDNLNSLTDKFQLYFSTLQDDALDDETPQSLKSACYILRILHDMALDQVELTRAHLQPRRDSDAKIQKRLSSFIDCSMMNNDFNKPLHNSHRSRHLSTGNLHFSSITDPLIVHSGALLSFIQLIVSIDAKNVHSFALQRAGCEILKSLVRNERNQQIMCNAGLPHELLSLTSSALSDESHDLHLILQYIFERLAAQSLTAKDLRDFLRLGDPLCCQNNSLTASTDVCIGNAVPLTRVKCLVSMTTPRDVRLHGATITPAYTEFDMVSEGFGCMLMTSLSPQIPQTTSVVGSGMLGSSEGIIGGVGNGERIFPPSSGITFSTWFCVDNFSTPSSGNTEGDSHTVRLLTITRGSMKDEHTANICFSVHLDIGNDRALFISTKETPLKNGPHQVTPPLVNELTARFWSAELIQEGQWRHLVVVLSRAGMLKYSNVTIYVDGNHAGTEKLHYITPGITSSNANSTNSTQIIQAYVGTPPILRRPSRLIWRQGPFYLFEDALSSGTVKSMFSLGPNYVGCYQSTHLSSNDSDDVTSQPLIAEDKLIVAIHAHALSSMTISRIRKIYSTTDARLIAKQLVMSIRDKSTPIRVLHNAAGHLLGSARSFGAILIGYVGVRTFCPNAVARVMLCVGGASALLGLIAQARDVESLYAAVKALVCVCASNSRSACREMKRANAYQMLALLLKKKRPLLNSHILHLTFSLIGTVDSVRETTVIPDRQAFDLLLCDLQVWQNAPHDLEKSLYEHFFELITDSSEHLNNVRFMQRNGLVPSLLRAIRSPRMSEQSLTMATSVLCVLLHYTYAPTMLRFGQFLVNLLPPLNINENELLKISDDSEEKLQLLHKKKLRNICLDLLLRILDAKPLSHGVNQMSCDEILKVLGFDWLMLFMQGHVHSSTVIIACHILRKLLYSPVSMTKFRESAINGGWFSGSSMDSRIGQVLGFDNKSTTNQSESMETCNVTGFMCLNWLLPVHYAVQELYVILFSLLLSRTLDKEALQNCSCDEIQLYVFGDDRHAKTNNIIMETSGTILMMMRQLVITSSSSSSSPQDGSEQTDQNIRNLPSTILRCFQYLYSENPKFLASGICDSTIFLSSLTSAIVPNVLGDVVSQQSYYEDSSNDFYGEMVKSTSHSQLNEHPLRDAIVVFLRRLVCDNLAKSANKSIATYDLIEESYPEYITRYQRRELNTKITMSILIYLIDADALLGDQAALIGSNASNHQITVANIFALTSRIVDRLWNESFSDISKDLFDCILKLIIQAKRTDYPGVTSSSLDALYKSLDRVILYQLSRPLISMADQTRTLETLHVLMSNRALVFARENRNYTFAVSLCYCLLNLTQSRLCSDISIPASTSGTMWHLDPDSELPEEHATRGSVDYGGTLLVSAAERIWDEVYKTRRPIIEETLKIQLKSDTSSPPTLSDIRNTVTEPASKIWFQYLESERKYSPSSTSNLQTQLQSKLQKVGHGVMRLTSRKSKRDMQIRLAPSSEAEFTDFLNSNIQLVKEIIENQKQKYLQNRSHTERILMESWRRMETELTRERGVWGPRDQSDLDRWKLDMTEGPNRMRKKLLRNDNFYENYPHMEPAPIDKITKKPVRKSKIAMSRYSKRYFERRRALKSLVLDDAPVSPSDEKVRFSDGMQICDDAITSRDSTSTSTPPPASPVEISPDSQNIAGTNSSIADSRSNNELLLKLLETGEKISNMFRCARIEGLEMVEGLEGLLLFGKEHFYILDGYVLLQNMDIVDIDTIHEDNHKDPIIPETITPNFTTHKRKFMKFLYTDIREVHRRRYLLQPIALEVFSLDGRNFLLAFPKKLRDKVYMRFLSEATSLTDHGLESVSGQKQNVKVEPGTGIISSLIGEKSVVEKWTRGEISNFDYLMCLNTLAGRCYNDMMQYLVFPWVLADYKSNDLDLTNPASFRDFSKPMGAQTPDRLSQYRKRYRDWDDPQGETPAYHYGTHYSSAMIVASYLVRLEPFTQYFLRLQGGHFDLADRMFHSINDAWFSASQNNMADVKELVPEFFYLPEMFENLNHFELGTKQSGISLNNVQLPPWAKGDPREFVRRHREALECDYVSAHLNEWIDLIFGCKQQGDAAYEADNVFHHLFYEGNVDIFNIDDPLKKNATIGFINNFGQIPKQLFKKLHPQKKLNKQYIEHIVTDGYFSQNASDPLFYHCIDNLKPSKLPIREIKGSVGQIIPGEKAISVEQNKTLIPPSYKNYVSWGYADRSLRISSLESDKVLSIFEDLDAGEILCTSCPNDKTIITAGSNAVVNVWSFNQEIHQQKMRQKLKLKQPLYGHLDAVTCITTSTAYNIILSGSRDETCIIWHLSSLEFVRQLRNHGAPVAAVQVNDLTVSGNTVDLEGDIATCAGTHLFYWSINGDLIADINTETGMNQQIYCVAMSQMREWDNNNVILTGNSDGTVRIWGLQYMQVYDGDDSKPSEKSDSNSPDNESISEISDKNNKDDFVFVERESKSTMNHSALRSGFKWKRQLILRSKLTMHTAFDRKDNPEPASVTSLAISKDHKTVYVGDTKGRIYSWTLVLNADGQQSTGRVDHWISDITINHCSICSCKFTFSERKHHCRDCGHIFCNKCTSYEKSIPRLRIMTKVRVCKLCFET